MFKPKHDLIAASRLLILALIAFTATATTGLAARVAAQIVVVGTGNPNIDVRAVQAAVDQGGDIILKGHFSFNKAPTVPTAIPLVGGSCYGPGVEGSRDLWCAGSG